MTFYLIISATIGAYAVLGLLGGERQRRLYELDARVRAADAANESAKKFGNVVAMAAEPARHAPGKPSGKAGPVASKPTH